MQFSFAIARCGWNDADATNNRLSLENPTGNVVFINPVEGTNIPWMLKAFTESPWREYTAFNSKPHNSQDVSPPLFISGSEATGYLSSILLRQAGVESKATATLGMHISMMSLSSLPGEDFMDEIKVLGNITKMSSEDLNDLKSFGQGKERALSNFLAQRERGQILDFADLIQDPDRLEKIKSRLGGRTQIFLPGAETLENFEGFKIRGSGQTVQIEGEYTRYLTDLISSVNALSVEKTDELFDRSLLSFEASKRSLSKVVIGTAFFLNLGSGNVNIFSLFIN